MTTVEFEEFFKIPTRIYRNIGRDPLNMSVRTLKEKVLLTLQCYIMFAYFSYLFIGQAWNAWDNFHSRDTLLIAFGAASCDGFCVAALLKEIVFAIQNKTMLSVTAELKNLFPKDLKMQEAYKALEYRKKTTFLLTSLVCACLGFTMGWAVYPIIKPTIKLAIFGPPFEKEFAFYIKYPYDQYGSNFNFIITTLGELIGGIMSGTLFLSVDLILSAIIYNCCMHMDYISRTIENYIPTGDDVIDLGVLDPLIKLHINILKWVFGFSLVYFTYFS
ncbi:GPROR8.2 family protein [Megaselia abdita]